MNGVVGMAGLLLNTALDAEQRDLVETLGHSSEALLAIINDILDFSKIEAGCLKLESIDFNLAEHLEHAIDLHAPAAAQKGLELVLDLDPEVPAWLRGDPQRLSQILLNLVGNAIKFTARGEVGVHVRPATAPSGRCRVCFEVTDTGIGIPTDVQSALFQRFVQADSSTTRRFGGTGLGLAICKRLAELMGGEIGVHSLPGAGATFWFTVEIDAAAAPAGKAPALPPVDLSRHRVLVVDDNATNRKVLARHLGFWRMPHALAESGDQALAELYRAANAGEPYDLVILDYQMPAMDGLMLADAIRVELCLGRPALVLLTSLGDRLSRAALETHGLAACEIKPLHPDKLRATLVQVLTTATHADPTLPVLPPPPARPLSAPSLPVLIAEDNAVNQKVARLMLHNLGYTVDIVTNGFEAVAAVQRKPYAFVLMEAQMPVMDGLEATRRIRAAQAAGRPGFPRVLHIVAMTANALMGDRELCLAAGMNDYVAKPVKPEAMRAVLARYHALETSPPA